MNVSILILSFNEEKNLPACLGALSWCDDIVILDSGSTDRTVEIAKAFGARLLSRAFDNFAAQRNYGIQHGGFRNNWILHLDADEIVTPEFVAALDALVPPNGVDAYNVPSKLMLFGRWIKHAGMYPTYQVRLGHRDHLRFVQVGHGQQEDLSLDRVALFDVPYLHYSFSHGMTNWLYKHVRYARDEAALILEARRVSKTITRTVSTTNSATHRRRVAKLTAAKLPVLLRPLARFFYVYCVKRGFLDGRVGLAYAFMLAIYEGMIAIFVLEAKMPDNSVPIATNSKD